MSAVVKLVQIDANNVTLMTRYTNLHDPLTTIYYSLSVFHHYRYVLIVLCNLMSLYACCTHAGEHVLMCVY